MSLFIKKNGLPSDELSDGIYYDAVSGEMYVSCKSGFIQFNAKNFSEDEARPTVLLTNLLVNDYELHTDLSKPIRLNYKQNNLTLNFTAVDLVNGSDLKFRYRLIGENDWNDPGKNRQIHFSNLSPGNYVLLITAANKLGIWNENATSLSFSIQPPFWKTGWFYLLVALVIITIMYALYQFRIKQLQRVQDMRNRIAQDLHDDVGGTMTAMNLTNELAMQHLQEPAVAKKLMLNISEDLKNVGETLDDIVWTVNPKNDSMSEVMARMRRYASHTWETAGIDFSFEFENDAESVRLNMEQRHDLYLVFKEAVNNVAKHAQCKQAFASLFLKDHSLIVEVEDNGKGFDVNSSSHRNGLKNMRSRTEKWKGEFTIRSSKEDGTQVRFRLAITQKGD